MERKIQKLIYIETTIPSFYHTLRTDAESRIRQKWTRQWWDEYADIFTLVSSAAVIEDPSGDALHLAIASFYNVDSLLTWNCRHLANANKIHLIREINQELGLSTPELTTPLNYLGGDA